MSWSSKDPKWWRIRFNIPDTLLGPSKYTNRDLAFYRVNVMMPEGPYPSTVRVFESTWQRPRWPWPTRMVRSDLTPDYPIPEPGKGENSWDMDDDALYAITVPVASPEQAAIQAAESVMKKRIKYGFSTEWRSEKKWKPNPHAVEAKAEMTAFLAAQALKPEGGADANIVERPA